MNERERFLELLGRQPLSKGDVAFVMQGDGLSRASYAVKLVQDGYAPIAAIVGSADNRAYGSFPSREVRDEMVQLGLPAEKILFEDTVGAHTRAEADRAMGLAQEHGWKTILIVTSPHHQYRAYLTFLKSMRDARRNLSLVNAPAPLSMTEVTPWGRRGDLVEREFDKITEYQKKGDVASYDEGVAYLNEYL